LLEGREPIPAVSGPGRFSDARSERGRLVDQDGSRRHSVATDEGGRPIDRRSTTGRSKIEGLIHPRSSHADARPMHQQGVVPHMEPGGSLRVVDRLERRRGMPGAQLTVRTPNRDIAVQPTWRAHEGTFVAVLGRKPTPHGAWVGHLVDQVPREDVDHRLVLEEVLRQRTMRVPRNGDDRTGRTTRDDADRDCVLRTEK
jgi:hypothetical protein